MVVLKRAITETVLEQLPGRQSFSLQKLDSFSISTERTLSTSALVKPVHDAVIVFLVSCTAYAVLGAVKLGASGRAASLSRQGIGHVGENVAGQPSSVIRHIIKTRFLQNVLEEKC